MNWGHLLQLRIDSSSWRPLVDAAEIRSARLGLIFKSQLHFDKVDGLKYTQKSTRKSANMTPKTPQRGWEAKN